MLLGAVGLDAANERTNNPFGRVAVSGCSQEQSSCGVVVVVVTAAAVLCCAESAAERARHPGAAQAVAAVRRHWQRCARPCVLQFKSRCRSLFLLYMTTPFYCLFVARGQVYLLFITHRQFAATAVSDTSSCAAGRMLSVRSFVAAGLICSCIGQMVCFVNRL